MTPTWRQPLSPDLVLRLLQHPAVTVDLACALVPSDSQAPTAAVSVVVHFRADRLVLDRPLGTVRLSGRPTPARLVAEVFGPVLVRGAVHPDFSRQAVLAAMRHAMRPSPN